MTGRLALGALAARAGTLRTYQGCFALIAVRFAKWLLSPGYVGLVVFGLLLGMGYGGFVARGPPLVAETFGLHGLGGLLAVLYTSAALGSAVGPPVAGVLISANGGYGSTTAASLAVATVALGVVLTVGRTRRAVG